MAGPGRRGPAPSKLGHSQVSEILAKLAEGHGRMRACLMVNVAYRTFQKRLAQDADLRDRVLQAEGARTDDCLKTLYDLRDHSEPAVRIGAAKAYLHRQDRQQEARRAIRERRQASQLSVNNRPEAYLPALMKVLEKYVHLDRFIELSEDIQRVAEELERKELESSQGNVTTRGLNGRVDQRR